MALKFRYLHRVDGSQNNNKLYIMQENTDGTFTVTFGREGATNPQTKIYPMSDWDSIYIKKTTKKDCYTDITEYRSIVENTTNAIKSNGDSIISNDKDVVDLITALQNYASAKTAEIYRSESKCVTQKQIDDAQKFLDNLSYSFKNHFNTDEWSLNLFNAELTKLYTIIPRKMQKVADHLVSDDWNKEKIEELINNEQSNLDSMAGQVLQNTAVESEEKEDAVENTLLDTLGLEISLVSDKNELKLVKEKAQEHSKRILRVFKIINKETQTKFDIQLNKAKNKKTDILWHGSRAQNFWFILQQGLKIRPSGAIHNGSMFGNSLYFAIESDKSMGYTDNGRWVNGKANNKVYMALFNVHLGEQLMKNKHDSSCYDLNYKTISKDGYDSVWAKKGVSLYRDELMVYTPEQVTIKYLVEFSA